MLTFDDCLGLCELSEEEILALGEHEHLPEIVALELAQYLLHQPDGAVRISRMIEDDIRTARERGATAHAARLKLTLRHFIEQHGCVAGDRARSLSGGRAPPSRRPGDPS